MKKIILMSIGMVLMTFSSFSQGQYQNEFSVYGGGGVSTLAYKLSKGSHQIGAGGNFGLGYTHFFSKNVGIGSGIELGFYNSKVALPALYDYYMTNDGKDDFEFRSQFSEYHEDQNIMMINIPIMIQYETSGWNKFYLSGGIRFGLPLKAKYTGSVTKLKTTGYYDQWNVEFETQKFMAFGEYEGEEKTSDLQVRLNYMTSLESGIKWQLDNAWNLYTGIYFDYGFDNALKSKAKKKFIEYDRSNPSDFKNNSVLESNYQEPLELKNFTNHVSLLTVGVKMRLTVGAGKNLTKEKVIREAQWLEEEERKREERRNEEERLKMEAEQIAKMEAERIAAEEAAQKARIAAERIAAETELMERERQAYLDEAEQRRQKYTERVNVNYYELGVMTLTDIQKRRLDNEIRKMMIHPNMKAKITGHACSIGSYEINIYIGQERADIAKDYMVEKGIAPNRIETFTKGNTEPLVPNTTEENRKKNRRIEVEIR